MLPRSFRSKPSTAGHIRTGTLIRGYLVLILTLGCVFSLSQPAAASPTSGIHYYISPTGSDSNLGTSRSTPFKTIQRAANLVSPGDTVTVLAGSYATERVQVKRSGTLAAPITFQAEGSVTMKGFSVLADGIVIRGFYITNTDNDGTEGWGIYYVGSNCLIESNHIYYATHGGINLYTDVNNPTKTSNCTVADNQLERNSQVGIEVHGRNHLVEGNVIWGTIQYHPKWVDPPDWVDADGIHFFGSGHIFRHNTVQGIVYGIPENKNPHIDCFQTFAGSDKEKASNVTFEDNLCDDVSATGSLYTKGFMLEDADHILIRNNIIRAVSNINMDDDSDITIVNNDLASDLTLPTSYDINNAVGIAVTSAPNTVIENNIFYNLPNHIYQFYDDPTRSGLKIALIAHNMAYRSDGAMPGDVKIKAPTDLWQVNPGLVNPAAKDFHLMPYSAAIDIGASLASVPLDYDGNPRPHGAGYDLGAYEKIPNTVFWLPVIVNKHR
jgi:hypothetical protein